ncbi:hypothetical protein [Nitrosomonas sp.]|uniref:hypothetical protein n=1 Tax=Nitrosomonas sp. TaxID=42353 RepID=UPI0033064F87
MPFDNIFGWEPVHTLHMVGLTSIPQRQSDRLDEPDAVETGWQSKWRWHDVISRREPRQPENMCNKAWLRG